MKPSNILFANDGKTLKISDFGLAKPVNSDHQVEELNKALKMSYTANVGTSWYMAPELQDGGGKYDHKIDIFSLGLIGLELFQPYYTKMDKMEAFQEARNGNIPQFAVRDQVKKMLLLDPEQRPEARLVVLENDV